jgi:hypothetical protein
MVHAGGEYGTAFQAAMAGKAPQIIELLLAKAADL